MYSGEGHLTIRNLRQPHKGKEGQAEFRERGGVCTHRPAKRGHLRPGEDVFSARAAPYGPSC